MQLLIKMKMITTIEGLMMKCRNILRENKAQWIGKIKSIVFPKNKFKFKK